jgi:5'-3' exonuclease
MKYYTTGCSDWRWCYKYSYPPLLKDLIRFVPYFDIEFISNKPKIPVSKMVQLCYVLPYHSLNLLPKNINAKLSQDYPEWHKPDCEFTWAFCKYFWESHVDLPEIDLNKLEKLVSDAK